jgi:opacity protein-like surface antigen
MRLPGLAAWVSVVALLWLTVGAVAARAEQGDDFVREGLYVGLAGLYGDRPFSADAIENEVDIVTGPTWQAQAEGDADFGVEVRAGYRLHSRVAAEFEANWRSPAKMELTWGAAPGYQGEAKVSSWLLSANAKGYLFLGRIQPYVLLGVGVMNVQVDDRSCAAIGCPDISALSRNDASFAMSFGGGADMYVTEHVSINAELRWVQPVRKLDGFDTLSVLLGAQYHF